ncbi:hypothetical protein [Hydrogenobacter thermophilus]
MLIAQRLPDKRRKAEKQDIKKLEARRCPGAKNTGKTLQSGKAPQQGS